MHTLTHMPTNNTHTPLPPPTARHPPWLARAAWTWGMQPLGTLKHAVAQVTTQKRARIQEAFAPAPCTLMPGVLRGPSAMLHRNRFCFLRIQLSCLCPRAFHGSLLPTVLSPNKSNFSVDSGFFKLPRCT